MTNQYWMVKSEPESYSWDDLVRDGRTEWTGVRSFAARQHLNAMRPGDSVLFYESVTTKAVVGVAEVTRPAFPDPTADEPGWIAVELKAAKPLGRAVSLEEIKAEPSLNAIALVRQGRLSVLPLRAPEYRKIVAMAAKPRR